jgi:hypothetical protein
MHFAWGLFFGLLSICLSFFRKHVFERYHSLKKVLNSNNSVFWLSCEKVFIQRDNEANKRKTVISMLFLRDGRTLEIVISTIEFPTFVAWLREQNKNIKISETYEID